MKGTRTEILQTALNLSPGKYEITATLRTPEGKVRDTESTSVSVDAATPRTLKMELSRFKHHVEFETVIGKPEALPVAAGPPPKPPTPAKEKPLPAKPAATPK